jgi:hypothetical protein
VPIRHLHSVDAVTDRGVTFQAFRIGDDILLVLQAQRSRHMRKQRAETQAEKDFDAEVEKFNKEAQEILEDRRLSMNERRKLITLKGKALLRRSAANPQPGPTQ